MRQYNNARHAAVPLLIPLLIGVGGFVIVDQIALDGEFTGEVLEYIIAKLASRGSAILDFIFEKLEFEDLDTTFLSPYVNGLSYFFPLDLLFTLIGSYLAFYGFFVPTRYLLKMIRGA